jgi:hypothetical protein
MEGLLKISGCDNPSRIADVIFCFSMGGGNDIRDPFPHTFIREAGKHGPRIENNPFRFVPPFIIPSHAPSPLPEPLTNPFLRPSTRPAESEPNAAAIPPTKL